MIKVIFGILFLFIVVCNPLCPNTVDHIFMSDGQYISSDGKYSAILNISAKYMVFSVNDLYLTDTIGLGSEFIVEGCPTNISYACAIHCYILNKDSININNKNIANPIVGPSGNLGIIICEELSRNTTGGAGLFPETNDTTKYIQFEK